MLCPFFIAQSRLLSYINIYFGLALAGLGLRFYFMQDLTNA
jgi:hypothetical protein